MWYIYRCPDADALFYHRMGIGRIVVEDAADPVSVIIFIAGQIPFLCIASVNFFSFIMQKMHSRSKSSV